MNLAYSLNQHLALEKVMNDILKMCQRISQDELGDMVLVISLNKKIDYKGDSPLPKIPYDPSTRSNNE